MHNKADLRVFLSYTTDDAGSAHLLKERRPETTRGITLVDFPVLADVGQEWKSLAEKLLRSCDGTICIIGSRTANSQPIAWELMRTAALDRPLVGIRANHSHGPVPEAAAELNIPIFTWKQRLQGLDRLIAEMRGR